MPAPQRASRRCFFAGALTAASAVQVLGANDRIRLGIVGTGGRGSYLMRVANQVGGIEWAGICDAWDVRRAKALEAAEGAEAYADYRRLLERKDLDAVIVSIADYEDSNSRWQADRTLATVQSAVGAAGYTLERFLLPGAPADKASDEEAEPDIHHGPGVLVFRRLAASGGALRQEREGRPAGRVEVLAILTVPEMPTSGIERLPLLMAAHLAVTLHSVPHSDGLSHQSERRIVAPFYSGSSLSLLRGLEETAQSEGDQLGQLTIAEGNRDRTSVRDLEILDAAIERNCRELHARFLAQLPRLSRLADRVSGDVTLRLVREPQRPMAKMAAFRMPRQARASAAGVR